jgi:hypothetical protein
LYKNNPKLRYVVVFGHAELDRSIDISMDDSVNVVVSKLSENMPMYYTHGDEHLFKFDRHSMKRGALNLISFSWLKVVTKYPTPAKVTEQVAW